MMSKIEAFLEKSRGLIGDSDFEFEAVKDTLQALLKVNPDLVDSVFYERISRLVDSAQIAKDTQSRVFQLSKIIRDQQNQLNQISSTIGSMKQSFNRLHDQLVRQDGQDRQTRQKLNFVLEELEQYLRRHS